VLKRTRWVTAAAAALAVGLAGCGSADSGGSAQAAGQPPAADDRPVIRLGWLVPGGEIFYCMINDPEVASNLGEWYDVEWFQFPSSAEIVQGIAAGTLDGGAVGSLSVLNGIQQGAEVRFIGQFIAEGGEHTTTTWLVRKDAGISGAEDIAGKTVATNAIGSPVDRLARAYLKEEGGLAADEDYQVTAVPFPVMAEALGAGQVDVAAVPEPFLGQALATGEFEPIFDSADVQDPFVQNIVALSTEFTEEYPDAAAKFAEDFGTVADYVNDPANREAVIRASSEVTKVPFEVLESYLFTERDYFRPEGGVLDVDALQSNWDFFVENGDDFDQAYQVEDYVDERFVVGGEAGE
jgi:ABC-type nitrate/sulfonate/bicarbonate transport system substrate-binding protein